MNANLYEAINQAVLDRVPSTARRILDVGCGTGALGRALKRRRDVHVTGVTFSEAEADVARRSIDEVVVADLDSFDFEGLRGFDCIVCSHVLEHLRHPSEALRRASTALAPSGVVIVALPNVLWWKQRLEFLRGRFRYTDGGLMDSTHLVFFDRKTAGEVVEAAGLRTTTSTSDGGFPLSRYLGPLKDTADRFALTSSPGLFATQFVFVAERA